MPSARAQFEPAPAGSSRLIQSEPATTTTADGMKVEGAFFPVGGIARPKGEVGTSTAAWEDSLIGRVLDQRYRIDARIGAGAMGVVYKATHVIIDKPLAIKLLRPDVGAQPDVVKRFLLEAQLAGRIKLPNVVEISDYGQIAGQTAYYVMEYLTGSTLAHRIDEVGRLEPALAIDIAIQTAQALQAAHANKIVHRDLKSENIFLCERADGELQVKILDFGIARVRDKKTRLTAMGALIGTPAYMSPEQAQGQEVDERSDLYALGIILFEMLAGRVPFKAPTVAMVLSAQIFDAPPTLKEVEAATADLPNVEHLIHLLLAKNRDERPKDAAEVIHLLRTAAEVDLQPSSMLSTSSAARRRATVTIGSWSVADNPSGLTRVDPPVAAVGEARTTPRPDVDAVTARPVTASGRIQRRPSVIVPVGTPVERFAAPLTRPTAGDHDHRQSPTGVNRAVRAGPPMILIVAAAASIGAAITVTLYKQVWRKSPAPVQSAAALPHAAPPPVVPAPTRITLESDPPGATVVGEDGEVWGVTPFTRELVATAPRTRVVFRLAGHDEAGLDVSPAESARLKIHLRPSVVPVAPAPTSPEVPAEVVSDPPKGAASGKPRPAKAKTEAAVDRPPDPAGEPPPPAEEELDMGELKNPFRKK
jgi:serine/threonine-protein kinase